MTEKRAKKEKVLSQNTEVGVKEWNYQSQGSSGHGLLHGSCGSLITHHHHIEFTDNGKVMANLTEMKKQIVCIFSYW